MRRSPKIWLLYLLVYWPNTLFVVAIASSVLLSVLGDWKAAIVASAVSLVFPTFNLGFITGRAMPKTVGKRR